MEFETDDRTVVAGASGIAGLHRGDVLGDRYEVRERLRDDAFTLEYRALDRRTENRVRLREVRPGLLSDGAAVGELLESLQEVVGIGGAFLPGLYDVGQHGPHVYVVEPWPSGMCLSDVFDRRMAQGRTLQPKELLPVVARLDAALAAVPEPWHHGDVRGRQVWIDAGHLLLTGAFLLEAIPTGAVAMILQTNPKLQPYFAPEVAEGWAADPADRYGVATLVWEGLLGESPPAPGDTGSAVRRLGPLGDVVAQYLAADPMDRPGTLDPLVEALSKAAGRPAPKLDPAPFRPKRPASGRQRRHDTIPVPPPSFPEGEGAKQAPPGQGVPAELGAPAADPSAADEWDALPTRQFDRSSMNVAAEPTDPGSRGAAAAAKPKIQEVEEPEIEEIDPEEIELEADDLQPAQPHGPGGAPKAKVPVPEGIKGAPRPKPRAPDGPVTRPSNPPGPSVVVTEAARRPAFRGARAAASDTADAEGPTKPEPRAAVRASKQESPRASNGSGASVWIVLLAFVAAAAILVGSLLVAQKRRQEAEAEKHRRIQERIEQLKQETDDTEPRPPLDDPR